MNGQSGSKHPESQNAEDFRRKAASRHRSGSSCDDPTLQSGTDRGPSEQTQIHQAFDVRAREVRPAQAACALRLSSLRAHPAAARREPELDSSDFRKNRLRGPIEVKRLGSVKGVEEDGQDRQALQSLRVQGGSHSTGSLLRREVSRSEDSPRSGRLRRDAAQVGQPGGDRRRRARRAHHQVSSD
jgi:hypothetical protein